MIQISFKTEKVCSKVNFHVFPLIAQLGTVLGSESSSEVASFVVVLSPGFQSRKMSPVDEVAALGLKEALSSERT